MPERGRRVCGRARLRAGGRLILADAFPPSLEAYTPPERIASAEKQRYCGGRCCLSVILLSVKALYPKVKAWGFRAGFIIIGFKKEGEEL